jgi:hypothetical protein
MEKLSDGFVCADARGDDLAAQRARNRFTTRAKRRRSWKRKAWAPGKTTSLEWGICAAIRRKLTGGTTGSRAPAAARVGVVRSASWR